ncbi:B12-binding domain-containing radical SAM protein [Desulfonema magnum]|uniref:Cobalamin-binding domain-containing protein n=1 Tax=Desulfonema magnum TaxID=45655 RepID=A0A975GM99_9BACT|nr:radical SAM protein [Desulfonema magnum]QTA86430.1 Cobalamin-binding domain-containing protein [Desulfonema magnum]
MNTQAYEKKIQNYEVCSEKQTGCLTQCSGNEKNCIRTQRDSVKHDIPNILLVNPWIHDFAAYDFWAKPMGILTLAAVLREHGVCVTYMDCLDRFHPRAHDSNPYARGGRGPYLKTRIPKPDGLEDVSRNFSRYGIREEWFREDLLNIPKPNLILVTSLMTYWYPGVRETIRIIREVFPDIPIILGGIYATLCRDHAVRHSGADEVVTGAAEEDILRLVEAYTGFSVNLKFDPENLDAYPYPALDLQRKIGYVPILTSRGCPFSCAYCASHFLNPKRMRRDPLQVVEEIIYWHKKYAVSDFVFYDDALLVNAEEHAIPMFENIIKSDLNIRFHTPNAVHIRNISKQTAELMFQAGFETLRLGLETTAFEERNKWDRKVTEEEFIQAISCLKQAGFTQNQMGAYLLAGLPYQSPGSVEASVRIVRQSGVTPIIAHYTPIPHTALWQQAVASSRYDIESDPVFTNNAIFPCSHEKFSWERLSYLKNLIAKA